MGVDECRQAELTEIRATLDALDERFVASIGQRRSLVERAGRVKRGQEPAAVRARARVQEVVDLVVPAGVLRRGGGPTGKNCPGLTTAGGG